MLDDLLELRTGDQVPSDGVVRAADGLEVDESLLTGETDPIDKAAATRCCRAASWSRAPAASRPPRSAPTSYARKLATEARRFQLTRSELDRRHQHAPAHHHLGADPRRRRCCCGASSATTTSTDALRCTVAGVVAMVPEGLVLLTSIAFGVAAVTLARRKVLVQELPAVEGLARVDVVCLDKTGTLTEGDDRVRRARAARRTATTTDVGSRARRARRRREPQRDRWSRSARAFAVARAGRAPGRCRSRRPGSGARPAFDGHGTWVLGAPEMVLADARRRPGARAGPTSSPPSGRRVLLLGAQRRARSPARTLPAGLAPVALVMLAEKVRPDAAETLRLLRTSRACTLQGDLGRQPAHRRRGGRRGRARPAPTTAFDARELPEDQDELAEVLEQHSVFGRVTPAAEAGDGRRAAVAGPRRGDDRRRRERRARAQGRRHRRGHGLGRAPRRARSRSSCCSTASSRRCPASSPRAGG